MDGDEPLKTSSLSGAERQHSLRRRDEYDIAANTTSFPIKKAKFSSSVSDISLYRRYALFLYKVITKV